MKEMDKDGLSLCSLQGDVFASSAKTVDCSSEVFMRRFMYSEVVKEFDSQAVLDDTLSLPDIFRRIELQFGKSSYGRVKYKEEVLFWIGYIYRYFSYTYELPSKIVYKMIKPKDLNEAYFVYHTFDPAVAIERILEEKDLSFNPEKQNERLLRMLKERHYEKGIVLKAAEEKESKWDDLESSSKEEAKDKDSIFVILYKEKSVGTIRFQFDKGNCILGLKIKDAHLSNPEFKKVLFQKAIVLAKKELHSNSMSVEIGKDDEKEINLLKSLGFVYQKEENSRAVFRKSF